MTFPSEPDKEDKMTKRTEEFYVAYWACQETYNHSKANAVRSLEGISMKVGCAAAFSQQVPIITNSKPLKAGDEVFVLKSSGDDDEIEIAPPETKKLRPSTGKGNGANGAGMGTGEGKGKTVELKRK